MKLLVTGYPPFDNYPLNSTHQLIESMKRGLPDDLAAYGETLILEIVDFDNTDSSTQKRTMLESYRQLIAEHAPDVCLFCGQAASRTWVTLETLAVNIFKGDLIDPNGPPAYWATLPDQGVLVEKLANEDIPAKLSYHAGTHLCNHILYTALHDAETMGSQRMAGFLHLPMTASQVIECKENRAFIPLEMMRKALSLTIHHILSRCIADGASS